MEDLSAQQGSFTLGGKAQCLIKVGSYSGLFIIRGLGFSFTLVTSLIDLGQWLYHFLFKILTYLAWYEEVLFNLVKWKGLSSDR